eukprot:GHVL01026404.1.p1 GENE.GHVL01026404.1~~GHVL01026404.1.p1  ORF type:complete len:136 (+),score=32.89 GHVL01026404.1:59-409(+)
MKYVLFFIYILSAYTFIQRSIRSKYVILATRVTMPELSPAMKEGKIVSWEMKIGEKLIKNDIICIVQTDKANMEIESPIDGYLASLYAKDGQVVKVGEAIADIAEDEEELNKFLKT